MGKSKKTAVIELIFFNRWNDDTGQLSDPVVTIRAVSDAIRVYNESLADPSKGLSPDNPANFMKDFIRVTKSANANWPNSVFLKGYTGRQTPIQGDCFEFILLEEGQTEAFVADAVPPPSITTPRFKVQSAGLPLASRLLGRSDEPWLMQVAVRLGVIESHLAFFSNLEILQVDHLQMNVKLGASGSEIDALYLAVVGLLPSDRKEIVVTCEAKGRREDILLDQIKRQVRAAFVLTGVTQNHIIPMAIKIVGPSELHLVEFVAISREESTSFEDLVIASESVAEIVPPVPGIG